MTDPLTTNELPADPAIRRQLGKLAEMFKVWGLRAEWPEFKEAWLMLHEKLTKSAAELDRLAAENAELKREIGDLVNKINELEERIWSLT